MGSKLSTAILRAVPGAYILNSGIGKLGLDAESGAHLQGLAATGIPQIEQIDPKLFHKLVAYGEIAVGSALLLPFVPRRLAGLALGGFAGGLLAIYFRNESLTEADGVRPSQAGTAISKDLWLAAIAAALVLGSSEAKD